MVIDGAAEELPVIEELLERLKTAQVQHLERRLKNLIDAQDRMEKRMNRARQLLKEEMKKCATPSDRDGWSSIFGTILDALNTDG